MAFDFQAAVAAANAVVEKSQQSSSGGNSSYAYPLLYPPAGNTVVFRPLFNPASGQILRLINRHEKVACYRTYNQDCPICQAMQQVKDVTGQDPFGRTKASRSRGLCFAQFISSTSPISKGDNKGNLQTGETVLMMFPWSVYQQINAVIQAAAQTPTGMDQAFSHAQTGLFLQVSVTSDFKYTTVNVPFMVSPTQMNDDQFMEFLNQMPSLSEQVLPSTITDDVRKQVDEYSDAIYRQYIAPRVAQPQAPVAPTNFNQVPPAAPDQGFYPGAPYHQQMQQPPQTTGYPPMNNPVGAPQTAGGYQPQAGYGNMSPTPPNHGTNVQPPAPAAAPQTAPANGKPACYGHHKENDTQCICCPCEVECMSSPF